jgi:hypothetical protein
VYVAALRQANHSPKEPYRLSKIDYETEEAMAQKRAVEPLMNEMNVYMRYVSTLRMKILAKK